VYKRQVWLTVAANAPVVLLPHEHGTYAEIVFPLATALALGAPGQAAWGLTLAATGGYLAHEAFVVLLGLRGSRARREQARAAWRSLGVFGAVAGTGLALALPQLTPLTSQGLALAAGLSGVAVVAAWAGFERTLGGEALAATALPAWSVPVALAGGVSAPAALTAWGVWTLVYVASTCAVQVVIARTRRQRRPAAVAGALVLSIGAPSSAALAGAVGMLPSGTAVALLPACVSALIVTLFPVSARRLRDIGWALIVVSLATLGLLLSSF
jgi:hypothetical protein